MWHRLSIARSSARTSGSRAKVYDPEGLLSTIPALATTLFGVLTGQWLRTDKSPYEKVAGMFVAGDVCMVIGWAWNPFFPINKSLVDQLLRFLHRRNGAAVSGVVLLAD